MTYNDELYHYGILGMKWGRRKKNISADKPKGDRGNWGRDPKSKKEQQGIDDDGINPSRSYGTKSSKLISAGRTAAGAVLGSIIGTTIGVSLTVLAGGAIVKRGLDAAQTILMNLP